MAQESVRIGSEVEIREGLTGLTPARIAMLYRRAPLLRPVWERDRLWSIFERSSLVLTAWKGARLVGIARVLSDGVLFSYLCDLAVEPDVQGLGIGGSLIQVVLDRCAGTDLVLRGQIGSHYAHLGFERVEDAWVVRRK